MKKMDRLKAFAARNWARVAGAGAVVGAVVQKGVSAADTVVSPMATGIDYKGTVEGLGTELAVILGAFLAVILGIVLFKVFSRGTAGALSGRA